MTASIGTGDLARLPALPSHFSLFHLVDQVDGIVEAHPLAQVDGGYPQDGGEVGLAGAGPADQNQIVRLAREGDGGQPVGRNRRYSAIFRRLCSVCHST